MVRKIISYQTIAIGIGGNTASTIEALSKLDNFVNKAIKNGWEPKGSITIYRDSLLIQSMINYSKKETDV